MVSSIFPFTYISPYNDYLKKKESQTVSAVEVGVTWNFSQHDDDAIGFHFHFGFLGIYVFIQPLTVEPE